MKALRLEIHQNIAHYRKEDSFINKMTYPLPPLSTIIGAIHYACDFKEYVPMDIAILGNYESLSNRVYTDNSFLNSTMDDRGCLVKMSSPNILSSSYIKIAKAKKQGSSFIEKKHIDIFNEDLLDEYINLKNQIQKTDNNKKERLSEINLKISEIKNLKSSIDKNTDEYKTIIEKEKEFKETKKEIDMEFKVLKEKIEYDLSFYRNLNTSIRYYELLNNVNLIIYIRPEDDKVLDIILENIYNLKSIGRKEDYIDLIDYRIIDLQEVNEEEDEINSEKYLSYIDEKLIKDNIISLKVNEKTTSATIYYINKNYNIIDNKRIFEKKKVVLASYYCAFQKDENVYIDEVNGEKLVVNFL